MRKLLAITLTIALLGVCTYVYASVGWKKDGASVGNASTINIQSGHTSFDGSTVTLYANGFKDGVTTIASQQDGPTNLSSAQLAFGIIKLSDIGPLDGSDARWISIANGSPGQMVTIQLVTATAGTLYISDDKVSDVAAAALLATGWDDIALGTALDTVTLLYVDDTYGWIVVGQYGAVLT